MIRSQIALLLVAHFAGPYHDGKERITRISDAVKYALASLPGLDCYVQEDGTVRLMLDRTSGTR